MRTFRRCTCVLQTLLKFNEHPLVFRPVDVLYGFIQFKKKTLSFPEGDFNQTLSSHELCAVVKFANRRQLLLARHLSHYNLFSRGPAQQNRPSDRIINISACECG